VGRTHTGKFHGELSPAGETPSLERGKSVRSLLSEEEGAAETMYHELTTTPNPCSSLPLPRRR